MWTSPPGCLMFTFVCSVEQGRQLPFLQYLVSLALVQAVRGMREGMAALPLALKWPNDIYVHGRESATQKAGGILCQSEYVDKKFRVITGVGLNVSNDEPSCCVNQLVRQYWYCPIYTPSPLLPPPPPRSILVAVPHPPAACIDAQ